MESIAINMVIVPGVVALLLFLVFTYLYEQSRQAYFRAWQIAWAAYTLHFAVDAWGDLRGFTPLIFISSSLLLVVMALCILVSTRLMRRQTGPEPRQRFRFRWYEVAVGLAGAGLAYWNLRAHMVAGGFHAEIMPSRPVRMEVGLAAVLLYCSGYFYLRGHRKNSLAQRLLALALAFWAFLIASGPFHSTFVEMFGVTGDLLGPLPQMVLGIAMVMVLFENERNAVQENALAFSTLGVDPRRLLSSADVAPSMQNILDRLVAPLPTDRAVICLTERWRAVLPSTL